MYTQAEDSNSLLQAKEDEDYHFLINSRKLDEESKQNKEDITSKYGKVDSLVSQVERHLEQLRLSEKRNTKLMR